MKILIDLWWKWATAVPINDDVKILLERALIGKWHFRKINNKWYAKVKL